VKGVSEIRRQPVDLPVAVAGRVEAAAAAHFLRLPAGDPVVLGPARRRFGERAFCRGGERSLFRGVLVNAFGRRRPIRFLL